jgi:hypothetical protein
MKIKPQFNFNKYDFGLGIVFRRENESKKYIREYKTINYIFGIVFLWFSFGFEIEIIGEDK